MDNIIREFGYYPYDKTKKLKNLIEYDEFIKKIKKNKKYNDCIFYIDIEKVNKSIADFLTLSNNIDNYEYIFYFNKDNFKYLSKSFNINKKLFIENLINLDDGLLECKVCFQKLENVLTCGRCFFNICNDCLYKSHSVNNKSVLDCKCLICKNDMGGIFIAI